MPSFADDFTRATLGSNWIADAGAWSIFNNSELQETDAVSTGVLTWQQAAGADQTAEIIVSSIGLDPSAFILSPGVRKQAGNLGGYCFTHKVRGSETAILKIDTTGGASVLGPLAGTALPVIGDKYRIEVRGSQIKGYVNDVLICSVSDRTYTSGKLAIYTFANNGSSRITSWQGQGNDPTAPIVNWQGWGDSGWGDPFVEVIDAADALLTLSCTIYRKAGVTLNQYGIPDQTPVIVENFVPCRLSTLGSGTEIIDPMQVAVERWKIFMRPRRNYRVSETHFVTIEGRMFEIISVIEPRDRKSAVHHLELFVREIMPSTPLPAPIS